MKTEYTISIGRANFIALLLILPIGVILLAPLLLVHGISIINLQELSASSVVFGALKFAIAVSLGVFAHELLHALGWVFFTKNFWRSIRFGIKWEYLTPYCHCKEPLKRIPFLIGAVLPLLVLGLLPAAYAILKGSFLIWFFGFFFTIAAGGDIIAIWMLRKVKKGQLIQDHPTELGFIILDKSN